MFQNPDLLEESTDWYSKNTPKNPGKFKMFVNNLWQENRQERLEFGEPVLDIGDYWAENRQWLRTKYRETHQSVTH